MLHFIALLIRKAESNFDFPKKKYELASGSKIHEKNVILKQTIFGGFKAIFTSNNRTFA